MKYIRPYKYKQTSTIAMILKIASIGVFIASLCIMLYNWENGAVVAILGVVIYVAVGFLMLGLSEVVELLNKIANQSYSESENDDDQVPWEGTEPIYKKSPSDEYKVWLI